MIERALYYINTSAREIDRALYRVVKGEGEAGLVVEALRGFQNDDGGFGRGIEPDVRMEGSSPIGTSVGLQFVVQVGIEEGDVVADAIAYLENSFNKSEMKWDRLLLDMDKAPHAPWWSWSKERAAENWANPTVEVIGYLNHFDRYVSDDFPLDELNRLAQEELLGGSVSEVHDLLCYKRYYQLCSDRFSQKAADMLFEAVEAVVEKDVAKWNEYVARPFDFVDGPDSTFAALFSDELLDENITYLENSLVNDHWEPVWDWGEDSEDWRRAKSEWSSFITVQNMLKMGAFADIRK